MRETNVSESCPNSNVPTKAKIRIAIADDHPIFRDGLCRLLSLEDDFDVVGQVEDGLHVSEVLQQCDPDILLLDLNMPGKDPIVALAAILAQSPTIPIVVLSASEDLDDVRRVLDAGAMGFIPKGETAKVILSALRLVLSGGIYIPPMLMRKNAALGVRTGASAFTPRQREVLQRLVLGKSNKEIGREMSLSDATVKVHLAAIFRSLNVNSRAEAVRVVEQRGLLVPKLRVL